MNRYDIILLINPLAKKKVIDPIVQQISISLSNRNIAFTSFTNDWPSNINNYKEAWLIGGDGTVNYFLNKYPEIHVPVVIFGGGTGNDFATKLYGNIKTADQVDLVLVSRPKQVDVAECNGRKFINGVGIGFDGEVVKSMNAVRWIGGHFGYLWVVIQKIFSFKENFFRISYDEGTYSGKFLLVMVTNSSTTGGGFKVSPAAKIDDGKLNLVLCTPLSILKRLRNLPIIEQGKHLHKKFILHKTISSITVECENETLAQIDGELFSAKVFDIKILPACCCFKY